MLTVPSSAEVLRTARSRRLTIAQVVIVIGIGLRRWIETGIAVPVVSGRTVTAMADQPAPGAATACISSAGRLVPLREGAAAPC